jgi:WD40 repeat protein
MLKTTPGTNCSFTGETLLPDLSRRTRSLRYGQAATTAEAFASVASSNSATASHHQISGPEPMLAAAGDADVILFGPTGRYLARFKGHGRTVRALTEIIVDGRRMLASAGDDRSIRIWNLDDGACSVVLTGHLDGVNALCSVTVDGRPLLASGGKDRMVRLWNPSGGSPLLSIPVYYPVLTCLEVSGLLFAGLSAGSPALNLDTRNQDLPNFREA